ncbi:MAG: hypothetical protein EOO04_35400 [Chitinophagaceae bacterium]|nr:MAG: hypothetical protein EOO04_35400 [Chitinophagaceae bacterium]
MPQQLKILNTHALHSKLLLLVSLTLFLFGITQTGKMADLTVFDTFMVFRYSTLIFCLAGWLLFSALAWWPGKRPDHPGVVVWVHTIPTLLICIWLAMLPLLNSNRLTDPLFISRLLILLLIIQLLLPAYLLFRLPGRKLKGN